MHHILRAKDIRGETGREQRAEEEHPHILDPSFEIPSAPNDASEWHRRYKLTHEDQQHRLWKCFR